MLYIKKNKTGIGYTELLKIHRKGRSYADTENDKSKSKYTRTNILKDLLKEQNNLCAYCMNKIDVTTASIEHIVGQKYVHSNIKKSGEFLDTDYNNMLAVCDGKKYCVDLHCDKSRANYQNKKQPLLNISPLSKSQMDNIKFTRNGKIEYRLKDKTIQNDLDNILNLNCANLVEKRKRVKDSVLKILRKNKFSHNCASKQLQCWSKFQEPYCQVAIEELNKYIE